MAINKNSPYLIYHAAVAGHRLKRWLSWIIGFHAYARTRKMTPLPHKVTDHRSILLRKLQGVDLSLQHNKVNNLKLACAQVNGIILEPGQKFSFWKLVGNPTEKKGYLPGLVLSGGEAVCGIGGGLCQMANLLHWMALHSPLTVIERHHHSFDMFPDAGRVIPFGTGASLFYNYIDFGLQNNTKNTFQLLLWVDDKYLHGEIRSFKPVPVSYHISEREHAFERDEKTGKYFRKNAIWRKIVDKKTGNTVNEGELFRNYSETKYTPTDIQ